MINFTEYQNALDYAKKCFLQDLKELEINSAQIFGSSTYEDGFVEGVSDIDICIFTSKMYTMKYKEIVDYIYNNTKVNFIDKKPSIVIDYIADRIEFYIDHPQIAIDVTIMAPELPNSNNMEETVAHDAVDVFLGAFYKYGIPLIGEIPNKKIIEDNFFPFYNDDLRRKRLDILIPRVIKYNKRLEILIKERNYNPYDTTLELTRASSGPITALTTLKSLGIKGFQEIISNMFVSTEKFREKLAKNNEICIINKDTEWVTTLFILKPKKYNEMELDDILKIEENEKEIIKEYNINYAKFILEKGKKGEISFTYTSSRSYKIPNTNIKLGTLKAYPMSVFLSELEIERITDEIFDSIEEYKKSLNNIDYTNLSSISDNMVYRKK